MVMVFNPLIQLENVMFNRLYLSLLPFVLFSVVSIVSCSTSDRMTGTVLEKAASPPRIITVLQTEG